MTTRIGIARAAGSAAEAQGTLISSIQQQLGGQAPCLVTVFASTAQPMPELMPAVRRAWPEAVVLGSTTCGEFTHLGDATGSVVLFALAGEFQVFAGLGTGVKQDTDGAVQRALQSQPAQVAGYPHRTALLMFDGLAGLGEEITLACATVLGPDVKIAGGAAGDDWAVKCTHVALGERVETDALVLATIFSKKPLGVGVRHGHIPFGEPLKITRGQGSLVQELNGKNAWKAFLEVAGPHAQAHVGVDADKIDNPGDMLRFFARYQTCLRTGNTYTVRTPLMKTPAGELGYACGVPEGSSVWVATSTLEQQLESARDAARQALRDLGGSKAAGALVFECGCRKVMLAERFGEAPQAISAVLGAPVAGLECYGEVAMSVGDFSGFHNSTTVVLAFPE